MVFVLSYNPNYTTRLIRPRIIGIIRVDRLDYHKLEKHSTNEEFKTVALLTDYSRK